MAPIRLLGKLSLAMNADSIFQRCQRLLKAHAYWRGVVEAMGTLSAWERLSQDAPLEPYDVREIDMDLSRDLENLEEFLETHGPADAIRLFAAGEPVGRIAPWAAGEALTAPYLKAVLISQYGSVLLGELVARGRRTDCNPDDTVTAGAQPGRSSGVSNSRSGGLNWPQ